MAKKRLLKERAGAFALMIAATAMFVAVGYLLQKKEEPVPAAPAGGFSSSATGTAGRILGSSFTDLFSGTSWIEASGTTMFHDMMATAFMFPPRYDWKKIETADARTIQQNRFFERHNDGSAVKCIALRCLTEKNGELVFGARSLGLPGGVAKRSVAHVAVASLDTKWLVGVVAKVQTGYKTDVYYFDGNNFSPAALSFVASSSGKAGMGGTDKDWIAVYTGERGAVYRVRKGLGTKDHSTLFNGRLVGDSFEPAVLYAEAKTKTVLPEWYVYSLTSGQPRFFKLFTDTKREIAGLVDLGAMLVLPPETVLMSVARSTTRSNVLIARVGLVNGVEYWEFTDRGFDKRITRQIVSQNINNYKAEVLQAKIVSLAISKGNEKAAFYLSNDGVRWTEASVGQDIEFLDTKGKALLWKAVFVPDSNPDTSSFIDRIELFYNVKFL